MTIDQQFVEYIVKNLVENPEDVKVERTIDEKGVLLTLSVNKEDLGRIIGRRGATAQSLRALLRALALKNNAHYNLKISDSEEKNEAVENMTDEVVENKSTLADQTRKELAELDDIALEYKQFNLWSFKFRKNCGNKKVKALCEQTKGKFESLYLLKIQPIYCGWIFSSLFLQKQ